MPSSGPPILRCQRKVCVRPAEPHRAAPKLMAAPRARKHTVASLFWKRAFSMVDSKVSLWLCGNESFIAERFHRVDFGGAACWEITCKQCHEQQENAGRGKAYLICAVKSVEHVCDQATSGESNRNSDSNPSCYEKQNLAHNQPSHIEACCTEGYTNTYLVGATADYI